MENLSLHLDMSTVKFLKYIQEVVGNTTQNNCKDHVATCKSDQHRCQVGKHYKHTHTHVYVHVCTKMTKISRDMQITQASQVALR